MFGKKVLAAVGIPLIAAALLVAGCSQSTPTPSPTPTVTVTVTPTPTTTPPSTTTVPAALSITTRTLGNGTVGVAYSQKLQAAGGTGPYNWAVSGGALPGGLTQSAGTIAGTPATAGSFSFTVQLTDSAGATTSANLSITIQRVTPIITTANLPAGKTGVAYSQSLAATDGVGPYTWAITDGALPAGLVLNAGVIAGTPTAVGTFNFTVQVTDSAGSTAKGALSINIQSAPVITTTTLPGGETGVPYAQMLAATGGTAPYTFTMTAGALPAGLTLNAAAVSGTPTATGTFNFTVQAVDGAGLTTTANITLVIAGPPSVTTSSLPAGKVGTAYSQALAVSGGVSPYTWSIIAGSLPGGLTLSAGTITGTPTTAGTFSFTVLVKDSVNIAATASLSLGVTAAAPAITTTALTGGEVSVAYSQVVAVSGGTAPYTWSITTGALPGGLTLNAGTIAGTPTAAGTFNFTVQVADSASVTATASLSIVIVPIPIISTTSLPNGQVGTAYSQTLAATGGASPFTWSLSSGTLPAGLTLNANGTVTGTPTTAGTSSFAVRVTDGAGVAITATLSITIP
jgi:large repetitive protein